MPVSDSAASDARAGESVAFDVVVADAGGASVGDDAILGLFGVQEQGKPDSAAAPEAPPARPRLEKSPSLGVAETALP